MERILIRNRKATSCGECLACFNAVKAYLFEQLIWVVPSLMVLNVLSIVVGERYVSFVVYRPLSKLVIRQSFSHFHGKVVNWGEGLLVDDLAKKLIFHAVVGETGKIMSCWVIRLVCEAVWVCIISESHVQTPGKLVHNLYEHINACSGRFQDVWTFGFQSIGSIWSLHESVSEIFG